MNKKAYYSGVLKQLEKSAEQIDLSLLPVLSLLGAGAGLGGIIGNLNSKKNKKLKGTLYGALKGLSIPAGGLLGLKGMNVLNNNYKNNILNNGLSDNLSSLLGSYLGYNLSNLLINQKEMEDTYEN